jgi:hypothetical protein
MAVVRTMARLRVSAEHGTTSHVTALLGLTPTDSHDIGELRSQRDPRPWTHMHWGFASNLDDNADLDEHLAHLCDQLEPRAEALHELARQGYLLDWFCFVEFDGQGGPRFGAELLHRLGALPVDLTLDLYGREE